MILYNKLFLTAYGMVGRTFETYDITYYPASVGISYKKLTSRDSFACFSFYDKQQIQYYLYFNAAYDCSINRMIFTSITIIPRTDINTGITSHAVKYHIDTVDDLNTFLEDFERRLADD